MPHLLNWGSRAPELQLGDCKPQILKATQTEPLCSTRDVTVVTSLHTALKSSHLSLRLHKACVQQQRFSTAKSECIFLNCIETNLDLCLLICGVSQNQVSEFKSASLLFVFCLSHLFCVLSFHAFWSISNPSLSQQLGYLLYILYSFSSVSVIYCCEQMTPKLMT